MVISSQEVYREMKTCYSQLNHLSVHMSYNNKSSIKFYNRKLIGISLAGEAQVKQRLKSKIMVKNL